MNKQLVILINRSLMMSLFAVSTVAVAQDTHSHGAAAQDQHSVKAQAASGTQEHADEGHDHAGATYSVGSPATAAEADRSIAVIMSDSMKFTFIPELASIQDGEVINFTVSNNGKINHEFSIGNQADQVEHAAMMAKMPNMIHDDPNTVTVVPGGSKSIAWRFAGDDLVVFACNIPGHYQAGMFQKTAIEEAGEPEHGAHTH